MTYKQEEFYLELYGLKIDMTLEPYLTQRILRNTQFNKVYRDIEREIGLEKFDLLAHSAEYSSDLKKRNDRFNSYVLIKFLSKIMDCNKKIHDNVKNTVFSIKQLRETEQTVMKLQDEILEDCDKYMMKNELPKDTQTLIFERFNFTNNDNQNLYSYSNRILEKMDCLAYTLE